MFRCWTTTVELAMDGDVHPILDENRNWTIWIPAGAFVVGDSKHLGLKISSLILLTRDESVLVIFWSKLHSWPWFISKLQRLTFTFFLHLKPWKSCKACSTVPKMIPTSSEGEQNTDKFYKPVNKDLILLYYQILIKLVSISKNTVSLLKSWQWHKYATRKILQAQDRKWPPDPPNPMWSSHWVRVLPETLV